jgi:nucleoside-diphosphate-sugar epimerase
MFGYTNQIVQKDLQEITQAPINWTEFEGKTILITGANGMLATYLAYTFLYLVKERGVKLKVLALSRSKAKSEILYKDFMGQSYFTIIEQDIVAPINYAGAVDYIFHLAGNASPYAITHEPTDILRSNLIGTFNVMDFARAKKSKRVFFASTREVYGEVVSDSLSEDAFGRLDPLDNRSCYPESKRAAESILRSYHLQYGIDCVIARIAHSYGPGMKLENDGRVMADFIKNAVQGEDIVLTSDGSAIRAFCYISDAVVSMLLLLLNGTAGAAYNLANETEPYPIRDVANMVAKSNHGKEVEVVFAKGQPASQGGYCKYPRVALDTSKIESLGFSPQVKLREGIHRTLKSFES